MSYDLIIFIIHATQIVFQGYEECSTVTVIAVHFKGRKYLPPSNHFSVSLYFTLLRSQYDPVS